jgi:WXG100 family type VII secretion target
VITQALHPHRAERTGLLADGLGDLGTAGTAAVQGVARIWCTELLAEAGIVLPGIVVFEAGRGWCSMSDVIRVEPEALHVSAHLTEGHAENVQLGHAEADGRIASSLPSWVGASMAAMAAKASEWQAATAAFSARLVDHADALRTSGLGFQQTDDHNAADIRTMGSTAEQADLENL